METLITGPVAVDNDSAKYYTVEQLAELLGQSVTWIRKRKDEGLITPVLFKGLTQFDRAARMRLSAYMALCDVLGHRSSLPGKIVRAAGPKLDDLARRPELFPTEAAAELGKALAAVLWNTDAHDAVRASLRALHAEPENAGAVPCLG